MAKSVLGTTIALDYPLWACDFDARDENRLVVGGGGGPGRHGVSNKIVRVVHHHPLPSLALLPPPSSHLRSHRSLLPVSGEAGCETPRSACC